MADQVLTGHAGSVYILAAPDTGVYATDLTTSKLTDAPIGGKVTKWTAVQKAEVAESKGAGEDWDNVANVIKDWEVNVEVEFGDEAGFDFNPTLLGARTYIALMRKDDDATIYFEALGMTTEVSAEGPSDAPIGGTLKVVCAYGEAPTVVTTHTEPAVTPPAAVPLLTGHAGAVSIGAAGPGAALAGKLTKWALSMRAQTVESKGCGLAWKVRECIRKSWEVTADYEHEQKVVGGAGIFQDYNALVGSAAYIACKRKSGDTNPVFLGTGLCVESTQESASDAIATGSVKIRSSTGSAPTTDTTPAA